MATDLDALVSNGEPSVGCCVRQDECGCGTSNRRNRIIDGTGKPAHQERASLNSRPLAIRAQSIHRSRPRLLSKTRRAILGGYGAEAPFVDGGLGERYKGKVVPATMCQKREVGAPDADMI